MIRVTFECESHDDLVKWATGLLAELGGYEIRKKTPLHAKETPSQFCERIGIAPQTFSRKVRRPDCPQDFEAERGPAGRIVCLKASANLEDFMSSPQEQCAPRVRATNFKLTPTAQILLSKKERSTHETRETHENGSRKAGAVRT